MGRHGGNTSRRDMRTKGKGSARRGSQRSVKQVRTAEERERRRQDQRSRASSTSRR